MVRLGKERSRRRGSDRRADPGVEKTGSAGERRVDTMAPKVAQKWQATVDKTTAAGAEAKQRGRATYHALKGDLRAPEPVSHRKRNIALLVGAVGGAMAYLTARRRRQPEWLTADITPESGLQQGASASARAAGWPASARVVSDRAAASPDEMISDAAETAASSPISPQRRR
jgi:hypothetical protein